MLTKSELGAAFLTPSDQIRQMQLPDTLCMQANVGRLWTDPHLIAQCRVDSSSPWTAEQPVAKQLKGCGGHGPHEDGAEGVHSAVS